LFGDTDTVVGNGSTLTQNHTLSQAGGDAHSNGAGGSLAGNVVQVSSDPVDQVFGEAGDAVGIGGSNTGNTLDSTAGGDTTTTGDYGSLAGNAVAVPDSVTNQLFGDAIAAGSKTYANGTNDSGMASGGTLRSSGVGGTGSGNVATVPVESDPDLFGDAVAALGSGTGVAENNSVIDNGGDSFTHGGGTLDAYNFNEPLGADVDVLDAPIGVLGDADTMVEDNSVVNNGYDTSDDSVMALPGGFGGQMGYGAFTPTAPSLPTGALNMPSVPSFGGAPSGLAPQAQAAPAPSVGQLPGVPQVPSVSLVQGALGNAGQLPVQHVTTAPTSAVSSVQSLGNVSKGLSGGSGISGVLPVHSALLPRI
jgi:hypothetical protein